MCVRKNLLSIFILLYSSYSYAQDTSRPLLIAADSLIFQKVQVEAQFPGGEAGWMKYLQNYLNAEVPVKNKAKNGRYKVIVRFIVSKDGTISNLVPETAFGYGMEEEVIRVIKAGPKWQPATQNGKNVNTYRKQPITFVVSE